MHEDAALGSPRKGLLHRLLVKAENHDVDALPRAVDGFDQWINAVARLDHELYQTRSPSRCRVAPSGIYHPPAAACIEVTAARPMPAPQRLNTRQAIRFDARN